MLLRSGLPQQGFRHILRTSTSSISGPAIAAKKLQQMAHIWKRTKTTEALSKLAPVPGLDLSKERLRRALFYVPCSEERKIQKSLTSKADCIMYDLEDGVSHNRKGRARELVMSALELNTNPGVELGVRINAVGSGLELDDLNVILQSRKLSTILVPKVESARDVQVVAHMVESVAQEQTRQRVRIVAGIETALGIMNIREIAQSDPRVDSLLFAAEDYCSDTGITRTPTRLELYYARSAVVTAAQAFKLQAIDMVCMDFRDMGVLRDECVEGMQMGFTGKQVIHPAQVDVVQECFMPPADVVARACRIVSGYERHYSLGKGAFDLDGKAIDMPVIKWAYKVLKRAELAGIDLDEKFAGIESQRSGLE